jgi:hypothetical protein
MAAEEPTYTLRYRLTPEILRQALWFALREPLPLLIGIALLALFCASWPALGPIGRAAAIFFPAVTALAVVWMFRSIRGVADQDLVLLLSHEGLCIDSGRWKIEHSWTAIRRIVRGPDVWLVSVRHGRRFFIPTAAIPAEARPLIARWAGQAGARMS